MAIKTFLEFNGIYSHQQKCIAKDAKIIRKQIDKNIEKKEKEKEKEKKQQEQIDKKILQNSVNNIIKNIRIASKTKESLRSIIDKIDKNSIKPETINFVNWIIEKIDVLKTNKKTGTFLITRNFNLIPKILNNPIIENNKNPKIISIVSSIVRVSNIELNPKFNPKNRINNYKIINNILFNLFRDLALELIRSDMMNIQGKYNGS